MPKRRPPSETPTEAVELRIIGGRYRGQKLTSQPLLHTAGPAAGERVTRPMKHRVREAIFNLVGSEAVGKYAIDVFAGTGALGLEAISRGAERALFIERHVPTAAVVKQNIEALGMASQCVLLSASAFVWAKRDLADLAATERHAASSPGGAWLVFISPPYDFFVERSEEMQSLISELVVHSPPGSLLVVEADSRFDFATLPGGLQASRNQPGWDVREYPPAVVGVYRKPDV